MNWFGLETTAFHLSADIHEASHIGANKKIRIRLDDIVYFFLNHSAGDIAHLHRERPTEAAAVLALRKRNEGEVAHVLEQRERLLLDTQQPAAVARRMKRCRVWTARAKIRDFEDIHEELAEFVRLADKAFGSRHQNWIVGK